MATTETWEKVKVRDLRAGDKIQVYAFVDVEPCTVTWINIDTNGKVHFSTDEDRRGFYTNWTPESLVFRVKWGDQ